MVIHASTEQGEPVRLTFHPFLQWAMGIMASLITVAIVWGVVQINENTRRITAIEASRFTRQDASAYVTVREYDAWQAAIINQLGRIEDKLDDIARQQP